MNIEKEFISYEPSLALKELGFDEECFSYYDLNNKPNFFGRDNLMDTHCVQVNSPTFSQAFRFFREKYGLEGLILPQSQGAVIDREPIYFIAIISYDANELMKELFNSTNQEDLLHYNPREEAELACLIKLIEIVKQ
jgi:hypothetical protein